MKQFNHLTPVEQAALTQYVHDKARITGHTPGFEAHRVWGNDALLTVAVTYQRPRLQDNDQVGHALAIEQAIAAIDAAAIPAPSAAPAPESAPAPEPQPITDAT